MKISPEARDLIVEFEVTSKEYYEKKYQRPEWPGVRSGVTIGIGYDVGYATKEQLWSDWKGEIPDEMIRTLEQAVGVTGQRAAAILGAYQSVVVPWDAAIRVFDKTVIPRWEENVLKKVKGAEKLNPNQFGALVSLAYNRGASGFQLQDARNREMNEIRKLVLSGEYAKIPAQFRSMKRLWPGVKGLLRRRDREAALFEKRWKS